MPVTPYYDEDGITIYHGDCREILPEKAIWKPGDPCASCGSTETFWEPADGASCGNCGKTDADEVLRGENP